MENIKVARHFGDNMVIQCKICAKTEEGTKVIVETYCSNATEIML